MRKSKNNGLPGICPINCKKVKAATQRIDQLQREVEELTFYRDAFNSLVNLPINQYRILGIEQHDNNSYAVVMLCGGQVNFPETRMIYLYRLPALDKYPIALCQMAISLRENRTAYIIDWASKIKKIGLGSILMGNVISFLRDTGYSDITGSIMPCDFDHETELRRFYTRFGFTITDRKDHRSLHLKL